jgi:hypothetical protein
VLSCLVGFGVHFALVCVLIIVVTPGFVNSKQASFRAFRLNHTFNCTVLLVLGRIQSMFYYNQWYGFVCTTPIVVRIFLKYARHTKLDQAHYNELRRQMMLQSYSFQNLETQVVKLIAYPLHLHVLNKSTEVGSSASCQLVIMAWEMSSYTSSTTS